MIVAPTVIRLYAAEAGNSTIKSDRVSAITLRTATGFRPAPEWRAGTQHPSAI